MALNKDGKNSRWRYLRWLMSVGFVSFIRYICSRAIKFRNLPMLPHFALQMHLPLEQVLFYLQILFGNYEAVSSFYLTLRVQGIHPQNWTTFDSVNGWNWISFWTYSRSLNGKRRKYWLYAISCKKLESYRPQFLTPKMTQIYESIPFRKSRRTKRCGSRLFPRRWIVEGKGRQSLGQ